MLLETQGDQDAAIVRDIISQLRSGKCGSIAALLAAAEIDDSPVMLVGVGELEVREALVTEAVVRCFDHVSLTMKRKVLRDLLQVNFSSWYDGPVEAEQPSLRIGVLDTFALLWIFLPNDFGYPLPNCHHLRTCCISLLCIRKVGASGYE